MPRVITAEEMRQAEQRVFDADPDADLMGRAARAVANVVAALLSDADPPVPSPRVLVAVGPGNNGGDGLYAATLLAEDCDVAAWLTAGRAHPEGLEAARAAGVRVVDAPTALAELAAADVVVDAVLGIGGRPGLPDDVAEFAAACGTGDTPVVAVDIPSGLDADSGDVPGASFSAATTVTFAALKRCHVTPPAMDRCGGVVVADIGVPLP